MDLNMVLSYGYATGKKGGSNEQCNSVSGHFDGHEEVLKQYMRHRLMKHVQGYTGSYRMLPSGDYSLRIAPAAARATINKTTVQNMPTLLAVLMAIAMRRCNIKHIVQWRRSSAFITATKCHHWASTRSNSVNQSPQCCYLA